MYMYTLFFIPSDSYGEQTKRHVMALACIQYCRSV